MSLSLLSLLPGWWVLSLRLFLLESFSVISDSLSVDCRLDSSTQTFVRRTASLFKSRTTPESLLPVDDTEVVLLLLSPSAIPARPWLIGGKKFFQCCRTDWGDGVPLRMDWESNWNLLLLELEDPDWKEIPSLKSSTLWSSLVLSSWVISSQETGRDRCLGWARILGRVLLGSEIKLSIDGFRSCRESAASVTGIGQASDCFGAAFVASFFAAIAALIVSWMHCNTLPASVVKNLKLPAPFRADLENKRFRKLSSMDPIIKDFSVNVRIESWPI